MAARGAGGWWLYFALACLGLAGPLPAQGLAAPATNDRLPLLLMTFSTGRDGQSVSSGKDDVDAAFLQSISSAERQLLSGLSDTGRFSVTSLSTAVPPSGIDAFLAGLARQTAAEPPLDGAADEALPEGLDWPRILQARYLLVPAVLAWDAGYTGSGENAAYQATLSLRIAVVDVGNARVAATVEFSSTGSDPGDPAEAIARACESAGSLAVTRLKAVPALRADLRIGELLGGDAILAFGSDFDVQTGDEFDVLESAGPDGDGPVIGRLVVRDVRRRVAFAETVWSQRPLKVGDHLRETGRSAVQGSVLGEAMINLTAPVALSGVGASVRIAFNQGMFHYRPLIELGFVVMPGASFFDSGFGLPVSIMGGAEALWHLGTLILAPNCLVGGVFLIPLEKDQAWVLGGLRAQVGLRVAIRFSDQIEAFVEPGWALVFSGGNFNGLCVRGGVSFR